MQARTTLLLVAALALACCGAYAQDDSCTTAKKARLALCQTVKVDPQMAICVDYKAQTRKTRTSTGFPKATKDAGAKSLAMASRKMSPRHQGWAAGAACKALGYKALPFGDATRSVMSTTTMPCNGGVSEGMKTGYAWTTLSCCPAPSKQEKTDCKAMLSGARAAKKAARAAAKTAKIAAAGGTTDTTIAKPVTVTAATITSTPGH